MVFNKLKLKFVQRKKFEYFRVKLLKPKNQCDYINANWLNGFSRENEFIATQGPIPATIPHFWQMVVENNVKIIVMVTKLQESEKHGGSTSMAYFSYDNIDT